ncbi:MAG: 1-aminocyclopropane-1-carboxylate deaminase/D-cysteine desulfhydrase [Cyclobacteriaceae bacterium]|nr:1-aminocyclopropane-1-carboxylate deaminase/D-cysteine desulfhydrase [Cyclobacteriaceae bacterium]
MLTLQHRPTLDPIQIEVNPNNVTVDLLRTDRVHEHVSGNKWYKLKYNLAKAKEEGFDTLLTFGGAFSNHIYATAVAAKESGFRSIGVIRGEEVLPLNHTLRFAAYNGMDLHYVSREQYRNRHASGFMESLKEKYGNFYLVPEGGTNHSAIRGAEEILDEKLIKKYDYFVCAVGTGGTLAGIISKLDGRGEVIGVSSLKGDFLQKDVKNWLKLVKKEDLKNWSITYNYHFGGYAKHKRELIAFINNFKIDQGIALDPIYTGKMMYGVMDMAANERFKPNSKVLAIHTGGLQGIEGFNKRFGGLIR